MKVFIVGDTGLLDGLALWSMADPGDVLLYVDKDSIPSATEDELIRLEDRIDEIVVVGGTARVSVAVESQLGLLYDKPTLRVAGPSRFATAAAISQEVHPIEPVEPPPDGTILWTANHEDGDLREWYNSPSVSGSGTAEASTENPHTGSYGLKLTANGLAGIRMKVQTLGPDPKNLPDDAYYSAWYHIPFEGMRDNVFQFKYADVDNAAGTHQTRRMICKASLEWNGGGYDLAYRSRLRQDSGMWVDGEADELAYAATNLPTGEWFHLEMRYVWGMDGTGRSTLWVDGVEAWDLRNISTEPNNCVYLQEPRQWAVNHYLSSFNNDPNRTTWIFVDDAKIATGRSGP